MQSNTARKWLTWFQCWHRNLLGCCVGSPSRRDFSAGDRSWVDFSVEIRFELVSCGGRQWLVLESGPKKIDLIFVSGGMQSWLVLGVGIEWLDFSVGIEIDLFVVRGSNSTLFLCEGRKLFVSSVSMDLTWFLWWSQLPWSQYGGSNSTWCQCRDEIDFVVVWVVEIYLLLVYWPNVTCFLDEHGDWLGVCVGGSNYVDFCVRNGIYIEFSCRDDICFVVLWVVEIDLVFERVAIITCF